MIKRQEDKYIYKHTNEGAILKDFLNQNFFLRKTATYKVSSIYYDTADLKCAKDNLLGVTPRKKYRARTYSNHKSNDEVRSKNFFFEKKYKASSDVYKKRLSIELENELNMRDVMSLGGPYELFGGLRDEYPELINYSPSWPLEKGYPEYIKWYKSIFS